MIFTYCFDNFGLAVGRHPASKETDRLYAGGGF